MIMYNLRKRQPIQVALGCWGYAVLCRKCMGYASDGTASSQCQHHVAPPPPRVRGAYHTLLLSTTWYYLLWLYLHHTVVSLYFQTKCTCLIGFGEHETPGCLLHCIFDDGTS